MQTLPVKGMLVCSTAPWESERCTKVGHVDAHQKKLLGTEGSKQNHHVLASGGHVGHEMNEWT
jgi:hypothetical protein